MSGASAHPDRGIGVLVFLHLLVGLMLPYILLQPIVGPPAGFLETAAGLERTVRVSVLLLFAGGLLPYAIAVRLRPHLPSKNPAAAQWLLGAGLLAGAAQLMENYHCLAMLGLSLDLHGGAVEAGPVLQLVARGVRSTWRWAHYSHLLTVVGWMCFFSIVLYRHSLVPRPVAALCGLGTLLQLGCITLPVLVGYRAPVPAIYVGLPLAGAYLAVAGWIAVRGVRGPRREE